MCGICGCVFSVGNGLDRDTKLRLVAKMNETLRRRGPDGEGFYVSNDEICVLGHKRLVVIDREGIIL